MKEYLENKAQMTIVDLGEDGDENRVMIEFNTLFLPKEKPTLVRCKYNRLIFFATPEEIERLKKEYTWYDEVKNEWDLVER